MYSHSSFLKCGNVKYKNSSRLRSTSLSSYDKIEASCNPWIYYCFGYYFYTVLYVVFHSKGFPRYINSQTAVLLSNSSISVLPLYTFNSAFPRNL